MSGELIGFDPWSPVPLPEYNQPPVVSTPSSTSQDTPYTWSLGGGSTIFPISDIPNTTIPSTVKPIGVSLPVTQVGVWDWLQQGFAGIREFFSSGDFMKGWNQQKLWENFKDFNQGGYGSMDMNTLLMFMLMSGGGLGSNNMLLMLMLMGGFGSSQSTSSLFPATNLATTSSSSTMNPLILLAATKGRKTALPLLGILGLIPPAIAAIGSLIGNTQSRRRSRTRIVYRNRYYRRR